MKNPSLIWNAALTVAVAVLYFLHFKGATPDTTTTNNDAAKGKKIVYVNADSLLKNYAYYKDFQKEFESKAYQLDFELNTKGRSLQNEVQFFQQRAQTMTQEQAVGVQQQLQKKEQDLVQYRDGNLKKLEEERQKKTEMFYANIFDYLKRVNKQNGYEFVLGYSKGGGILFANTDNEITGKILEGLNKEYTANKKPEKAAPAKK